MQLQLVSLAMFVLGVAAAQSNVLRDSNGGFVGTVGPFSLKISSADSTLNRKFLGQTGPPGDDSSYSLVSISDTPHRSFYWVPNSANPVPPGGQSPWGTLIYEVKFHTAAYNLTLDLHPWDSSALVTPAVLRNSSDNGTAYAHAASLSKYSGVVFLNDTSKFLACRSEAPSSDSYTLKWQTNLEPGHSGQIGLRCSNVIVSVE